MHVPSMHLFNASRNLLCVNMGCVCKDNMHCSVVFIQVIKLLSPYAHVHNKLTRMVLIYT